MMIAKKKGREEKGQSGVKSINEREKGDAPMCGNMMGG